MKAMQNNLTNANPSIEQGRSMTIREKIELLHELQCIDQQIMRIVNEHGYEGEALEEIERLSSVRPCFPDMLRTVLWREYQNRWRTSKDEIPSPIALVQQRRCCECDNELSVISLTLLEHQDRSGVIILCEHCHRILYSKKAHAQKHEYKNRAPDRVYFSYCWNCYREIHSSANEQCPVCGFFFCSVCGECLCHYPHAI